MNPPFVTSSPQASLADLFLGSLDGSTFQAGIVQKEMRVNQSFSQVLNNNLRRTDNQNDSISTPVSRPPSTRPVSTPPRRPDPPKRLNPPSAKPEEPPVRRSAVEQLEKEVKYLGVPLNSVVLRPEDTGRLQKALEDSGYDTKEIEKIMSTLSNGPMTMDRVLAAIGKPTVQVKDTLTITEESLPLIGQFLTDLGLGAEQVKEVLGTLQPGQKFNANEFRSLLLQNQNPDQETNANLRGITLAGVDQDNLKKMLTALGVSPEEQAPLWNMMKMSNGRVSLDGLISFLKSTERPEALSKEALDNIRQLVDNLQLTNTLKVQPYFNRVICLLESMGDREIDQKFLEENPAIQALRSGSVSARSALSGSGIMGAEDSSSQPNMGQDGWSQSEARLLESQNTSRAAEPNVNYRASAAMAKEIAEKMALSVRNQQSRLRIQLNPKEMGRLDINLVMKNNNLHASIVADSAMAKLVLEEYVGQLKETLAAHGLELESFDVSLSTNHQSDDPTDHWASPASGTSHHTKAASHESADQETVPLTSSSGLIDRRV